MSEQKTIPIEDKVITTNTRFWGTMESIGDIGLDSVACPFLSTGCKCDYDRPYTTCPTYQIKNKISIE